MGVIGVMKEAVKKAPFGGGLPGLLVSGFF